MTGIGNVEAEAVSEGCTLIGDAIPVGVSQFPEIWGDRGVHIAAPCEHAGRDTRDLGVEIFGEDRGSVRDSVSVGIGQANDFFGGDGQVLAVDSAVLVEIPEGSFGKLVLAIELFAEKSEFVIDGGERHIMRDPAMVVEFADIEIAHFAAGGFRDVDCPIHVDGYRYRVFHQRLLGNQGACEAVGGAKGLGFHDCRCFNRKAKAGDGAGNQEDNKRRSAHRRYREGKRLLFRR